MLKDYFKLIRPLNLLFLAAIQFLMYAAVVQPIMQIHGFETLDFGVNIYLLIAASVLICAGGYVINDYFDVKIDNINNPDKVLITNTITKKLAMLFYQILTVAGVIVGLVLAFLVRSFTLGIIFAAIAGLMWFYSASYKRQLIVGNLVVAFSSALSVLVVALMQLAVLKKEYGNLIFETPIPPMIYVWIGGFAAFAFVCTWLREIIKDMEDIKGDCEMECRTMPIKWGIGRTKIIVYALILLIIILLLVCVKLISFEGSLTLRYTLFGLILPLLALGYLVFSAKTKKDYYQAATLAKVIMLVGVLYSLVFYFLLAKMFALPLFNTFIVK
jgi:4-hydroxybenzoate polyprenyltransferase